jgi:acyl carrier protein
MEKIRTSVCTVFRDARPEDIHSDTRLGDIPGWDSMNGVNLLLELESSFGMSLVDLQLSENDRIATLVNTLRQRGAEL